MTMVHTERMQKLGELIDRSPLMLAFVNSRGNISITNSAWDEALGWSSGSMVGKPLSDFILESYISPVDEMLKLAQEKSRDIRFRAGLRHKSGKEVNLLCDVKAIDYGNEREIILSAHALSCLTEADQWAIYDSELFGKAASLAKIGYWSINLEDKSLFWSKEIYAIHGVTYETYTPTIDSAVDFYHPEDRDEVSKIVELSINDPRPWQFQLRIIRGGGEPRTVRCFAEVDRDTTGKPTHIYGICQDVTEYELLSEQVALLSKVAETSTTGVMICDSNRNVLWVNGKFEAMTGYHLSELAGRPLSDLLQGPETNPQTVAKIRTLLGAAQPVDVEILNYDKQGKPYWVHLLISVLIKNGKIANYIGIQQDITQQKRQQELMSRRSKMDAIGQLASGICHDINNILAIISGNVQLLSLSKSAEKSEKFIRNIEIATERASGVTQRLLKTVRCGTEIQEEINLDEDIGNTLDLLQSSLAKEVKIERDLTFQGRVTVNKSALLDSVMNVVLNAKAALRESGVIRVSTRSELSFNPQLGTVILEPQVEGRFAVVQITDNGKGISDGAVELIFEPFYTTQSDQNGTGLGLSLLFDFCSRDGIGLQVLSSHNEGTSFYLWLPITP